MAEGVQGFAHVVPERRLRIRDLLREAVVDVGDRRLEVVGRMPEAVSPPSAGSIAEDVPKLPQAISPARELVGHDLELAEARRRGEALILCLSRTVSGDASTRSK